MQIVDGKMILEKHEWETLIDALDHLETVSACTEKERELHEAMKNAS